ncbi:hypothetical protein LCGC14_1143950 [marine sediment metagenome]|uniref:PDZ domain-containing protein n=1 Tax=marine sediment metagenome TaxID=412755 RepID=A0A0F9M2B1_9ZZZZ
MKKIKTLFFSLALAGSIFLGTPTYAFHNNTAEPTTQTQEELRVLMEIIGRVLNNYVEERESQEVIDAAIDGVIKSLDKHSSYMPPKAAQDMMQEMTGSFFGIGAEVNKHKETKYIEVVSPIEGSPAEAAGIRPGDLIKSVNGVELKELSQNDAIKNIRGPNGTKAKMVIVRGEEELTIIVIRAKIQLVVVRSRMLENNLAYVRLTTFNQISLDKTEDAFRELKRQLGDEEFNGAILDLRNNPGGLLDQAIAISDLFLDEGTIITTRGRGGEIAYIEFATPGQIIPSKTPIIVLINEGSASASEIVAGTLQDLDRATIVGVKSYGKGSVQSIIPLSNGGKLRLTVAKYYTAGGTTPHDVGITPDVVVELPEGYWDNIPVRERRNHIDPQLQKAIDILSNVSNAPEIDIPGPNCDENPC